MLASLYPALDASERKFRYDYHSQTIGVEVWTCPNCGKVNRSQLGPGIVKVRCTNTGNGCHLVLGIGRAWHTVSRAPCDYIPEDTIITDADTLDPAGMPAGVRAPQWRGDAIHVRLDAGE